MKVIINESQLKHFCLLENFKKLLLFEEVNSIYDVIKMMFDSNIPREVIYNTIMTTPGLSDEVKNAAVAYLDGIVSGEQPKTQPITPVTVTNKNDAPKNNVTPNTQKTQDNSASNVQNANVQTQKAKNASSRVVNKDGSTSTLRGIVTIDVSKYSFNDKVLQSYKVFEKYTSRTGGLCARYTFNLANLFMNGTLTIGSDKVPATPAGADAWYSDDFAKSLKKVNYVKKYHFNGIDHSVASSLVTNLGGTIEYGGKQIQVSINPGDIVVYHVVGATENESGHAQFCIGNDNGYKYFATKAEHGFVYTRRGDTRLTKQWVLIILKPTVEPANTLTVRKTNTSYKKKKK